MFLHLIFRKAVFHLVVLVFCESVFGFFDDMAWFFAISANYLLLIGILWLSLLFNVVVVVVNVGLGNSPSVSNPLNSTSLSK